MNSRDIKSDVKARLKMMMTTVKKGVKNERNPLFSALIRTFRGNLTILSFTVMEKKNYKNDSVTYTNIYIQRN